LSFRYRLDGFDTTWVDAGTRRQAYYTNLAPGIYQFRVTSDNNGVTNDLGAALTLTIVPAIYQTTWFRLAVISLLTLTALSAWQLHLRQVRRRFGLVFEERARVAREIHDTLLQSLVGVAMQFGTLDNEIAEAPQAAAARATRLREQIEMQIREARQSIWDLRSPILRTKTLAMALAEAGAALVSETLIRFDLRVIGKPRSANLLIDETLLRIGQEAISNAVRHGQPALVRARLRYGDDTIVLTVIDDGFGFNVDQRSPDRPNHYGLLSMRERARIVGAQFTLVSQIGQGTSVEVCVPLDQNLEPAT
jgi:signal transduction histidine kinase